MSNSFSSLQSQLTLRPLAALYDLDSRKGEYSPQRLQNGSSHSSTSMFLVLWVVLQQ